MKSSNQTTIVSGVCIWRSLVVAKGSSTTSTLGPEGSRLRTGAARDPDEPAIPTTSRNVVAKNAIPYKSGSSEGASMRSSSRNATVYRASAFRYSAYVPKLAKRASGLQLLVLCAALGCTRVAGAGQPFHLSANDISMLYGRWETLIGNSDVPVIMRLRAKTITVGGRCPTAYKVLDVRMTGNHYIVEIKESKPATLGGAIKGMPSCLSNGSPFVAWRLLSSIPSGGLPPIEEFACQSYKDLRVIEMNPTAHVHCGVGGLSWSPLGPLERP